MSTFNQPHFSYFRAPITNTSPFREVTVLDVYHAIKMSFKEQTTELRTLADKKVARKFKAIHFDYVTFSGVFTRRSDQSIKKHSGLLAIDFDHLGDLPGLKSELLKDQFLETELLFVSPSGDGLKWVISIDLTQVNHQDYFKAAANYIQQTYQLDIDQSGKDVSRACFLPHDTNPFINPKYL